MSAGRANGALPAGVPADLLAAARRAQANAYAPYSRFAVGAAVRADDGSVHAGANVENASFGLTRCAEQSAVQAMVTAGRRRFSQVVVYTETDEPASPCGACRQVLFEFAPDAEVYLVNHRGEAVRTTVEALIPGAFGPQKLPS
ncbi:MAG TPA: cytidine deaminase [Trueperaceae bacterium]